MRDLYLRHCQLLLPFPLQTCTHAFAAKIVVVVAFVVAIIFVGVLLVVLTIDWKTCTIQKYKQWPFNPLI